MPLSDWRFSESHLDLQGTFNQQNIGLMFSDQFARIMETVCATANLISLIAPNDCGQPCALTQVFFRGE